MTTMTSMEASMLEQGLVAILRNVPEDKLMPVVDALVAGGVRFVEVTLGSPGALKGIGQLSTRSDMVAGAGTVKTVADAQAAVEAGARFLVCPTLDTAVIRMAIAEDVVPIPGVMTPTEMLTAMQAGAKLLKLFPASVLGPDYIRAIRAPMPEVKLLAVGGIDEDNAADYLEAGAVGWGIGSTLTPAAAIARGDYDIITQRARHFVTILAQRAKA